MTHFNFNGGYESRGAAFVPYRSPRRVWQEFGVWWERNKPGQPRPANHNVAALTGLKLRTVQRFAAHDARLRASDGAETGASRKDGSFVTPAPNDAAERKNA
jgi:hypothetical protein